MTSDASTDLAARRTGLAFQRTRLAADRTLMATVRTSLSLISFGFSIDQFFRSLYHAGIGSAPMAPVRRFALTLLVLGVVLLILGILNQGRFMREIRRERSEMVAKGELHGQLSFPVSIPLVAACSLLVLGVITTLSLILRAEPFH